MSVRIHQLSKDIGMENKELLELLQNRGFEVKSASSTVDNISADAIREEFASSEKAEPEVVEQKEEEKPEPKAPALPEGVFVKSAEDIKRERAEKAEAKAQATKPKVVEKAEPKAQTPPPPVAKVPATKPPAAPKIPPAASPIASRPPSPAGPPKPPTAALPPRPAGPAKPPAVPSATPPIAPAVGATPSATPATAEETETAEEGASVEQKAIHIKPPIVVRDFAGEIGLKPFKLISELMEMGIFASMNQTIEESVAATIATRHGCKLEIHHRGEGQEKGGAKKKVAKLDDDDPRFLVPRPPVVCILGHVDHGKTTLLDTIRKANVVAGEAGGITQHIGAYQITHSDQKISFIDTPGHAAFSKMRARGANVTDVAILVIAADDAFKPQTEEALKFAKEANNAIIVAINKIDVKGANIDRVKQQMQEKGIAPEDWGGETIAVEVSALNGDGIDDLLDMILLQSEVLELKANPKCPAMGTILEAQIEQGRGPTASVIVEKGTLKKGDALLCGEAYCKVKSLVDASGNILREAGPGTPAKVVGWSDVPVSGTRFSTEKNEKSAKRAAEEAIHVRKAADGAAAMESGSSEGGGATIEDLFAAIENQQKRCLRVILKSDVHGSLEALANALEEIESSKVDLEIISKGVGNITKNDVTMASAGDAVIVGFNVRLDTGVQSVAKHHDVRIIQHEIIYELLDQIEEAMADLLDAELTENKTGAAEVRQVFSIGKGRNVAGCMVTEGMIGRGRKARLLRNGELVHESNIVNLKRFKDDVKEVRAGYECGINIDEYDDYQEGDIIQCFEVIEKRASLR
ncbi:MAG: translation initiation factor IF-2 [Verrucomicrobiota bacterium]